MRDDFTSSIKEQLARRVAFQCSNPGCRRPTSGPHTIEDKSVSIGVAAHITGASQGGPRYDAGILEKERRSAANAIWLCQVCAKLIDSDVMRYSVALLRDWKNTAEEEVRKTIEKPFLEFAPPASDSLVASPPVRDLESLLAAYRVNVLQRIGKVYIFAEASPRELKKVFVDLTINRGYQRPLMSSEPQGANASSPSTAKLENEGEQSERREDGPPRIKRSIEPNELIDKEGRVIVTGSPGCGKTTLLRYLALRVLEEGKQLPVFLELNTLTEDNFKQAGNNLSRLVFEKAIVGFMKLTSTESEKLYSYFVDSLAEGKVALFLDGLDEVHGADFFELLCQLIRDFLNSEFGSISMVLSTRPNTLESRFEGLQEVEIAPLNQRQIEEFVEHYYGVSAAKKFIRMFRRYPQVRELMRVPFLLAVIVRLNQTQDTIVENRLELYRQIVLHLVVTMDKEKTRVQRSSFRVKDPHGWIKLEFLQYLAYERLFVESTKLGNTRQEDPGIIFTGSLILEKAKAFVVNGSYDKVDAHYLANDVVATPLLREVGTDSYAFAHLTIQEYLAAQTLAQQTDLKSFCRAYFDQRLAEGEILPMTLGLVSHPNEVYEILEQLPESSSFLNLRLRARGLRYVSRLDQGPLHRLIDRLVEFVTDKCTDEIPYRNSVMQSFFWGGGKAGDTIAERLSQFIDIKTTSGSGNVGPSKPEAERAVDLLGQTSGRVAIENLIKALQFYPAPLAVKAAEYLGNLGGEWAVTALIDTFTISRNWDFRMVIVKALGNSRDIRAVDTLCLALQDSDVDVQLEAITALERIGGDIASAALVQALKNGVRNIQNQLVHALGKMEGQLAADALIQTLDSKDVSLRWIATKALEESDSEYAATAITESLLSESSNEDVRWQIISAMGSTSDERALPVLIAALSDSDLTICTAAVRALGKIGGKVAETALAEALNSAQRDRRGVYLAALGESGGDIARETLIAALKGEDVDSSLKAASYLGRIGGDEVVLALIDALAARHPEVRSTAILALGSLKAQQSVPRLIELIRDPSGYVRGCAAEVLGVLRSERAVFPLCKSLEDDDLYVRGKAATALGEIGSVRSLESLIRVTKDENVYVRLRAVNALSQVGNESAIECLSDILNDWDREVAEAAARALGKIGGKEAVHALYVCWSKDFKGMVEEKSWREVVGQIWAKTEISVERLTGAISDMMVSVAAIEALGRIGTAEVVPTLLANLGSNESRNVIAAARSLGRVDNFAMGGGMLEALSHRDSFVRRKAAQFVAYYDTQDSAGFELSLMAWLDPDSEVKAGAKDSLAKYIFKKQMLGAG